MQQLFVELYSYRPAWRALSERQRQDFATGILAAVQGLTEQGVEVLGWGMNAPATDRRAPYDFFCAYRVPSADFQRGFEAAIAESGWHDYFDQVAVSGDILAPADLLAANVALRSPTG
ncbi:MAG: hypothetical protein RIB84_24740 [Sneathiellaceae bacterium]